MRGEEHDDLWEQGDMPPRSVEALAAAAREEATFKERAGRVEAPGGAGGGRVTPAFMG